MGNLAAALTAGCVRPAQERRLEGRIGDLRAGGAGAQLTVKATLDRIHRHEQVLLAIQREFVWRPEQICRLFDSLRDRLVLF
jgi:hypothetical protein